MDLAVLFFFFLHGPCSEGTSVLARSSGRHMPGVKLQSGPGPGDSVIWEFPDGWLNVLTCS